MKGSQGSLLHLILSLSETIEPGAKIVLDGKNG